MTTFTKAAAMRLANSNPPKPCNIPDESRDIGRARSAESRHRKAIEAYRDISPIIVELRTEGLSLGAIANVLNASGHQTRMGSRWARSTVLRVLLLAGV
jgi:hypothetical protein